MNEYSSLYTIKYTGNKHLTRRRRSFRQKLFDPIATDIPQQEVARLEPAASVCPAHEVALERRGEGAGGFDEPVPGIARACTPVV